MLLLVALSMAMSGRVAAQTPLEEVLARAAALTAAGQHTEAYALLSAEEDTHIGEIKFDYVLGRAALFAGRPDRATIAFERVLALDPGHAGARIDMGRAYLALGNLAQAEVAFQALLDMDPPPALRAQLLIYLGEARADRKRKVAARGYLSVFAGASSNVNQAPGQGQFFVPGLLAVLQLADQNIAKDDTFAGIGGGVEAARPLSGRYSLIAAAEFLARQNTHYSDFDVGGIWGSMGIAHTGDLHVVRAQLQLVNGTLGGDTSRRVEAVSVDVTETSAADGSLGWMFAFAHAGRTRHPPADLQIFDADFLTVGIGANLKFDEKSTASVAFLAGGDNDQGGNPSGDRFGIGFRLAGERVIAPGWRLFGLLGALNSRYDGFDPSFLVYREDRRWDLELIVRHDLSRDLELRVGAIRTVQDSNVPIYEYTRTDWSIGLRYQFN
ncbi:MAG TPA: tetratricopeptide repeat protein [Burkholderiales bacterium]|nr:tetratricopeptide repeat protein [Burkholderiales bacterium]